MPTPESPMFLAKKPKVPPTFDGVDYDDNDALKAAQDAIIREQWVKSMMARLIREELSKCYYREGVNHLEKCGALRGRSFVSLMAEAAYGIKQRDSFARSRVLEAIVESFGLIFANTERYFEALKYSKVRGYLFEQQNYIPTPEPKE